MQTSATQFELNLLGAFRLMTPRGERLEIVSRKGLALVAMLAMARQGERTRGWLQEHLWGTRQPLQARNSLRTELRTLRKHLNIDPAPILICEYDRVRLDLTRVVVDALSPVQTPHLADDFLEGLDIPGEDGFEDWLRDQRAALKARLAQSGGDDLIGAARSLTNGGAEPSPSAVSTPRLTEGTPPTLAVLPFANLTGDPANDYLAEGVSEDLIDRLSRLRWLSVIARSSSFAFGGQDVDRSAVGQALGAKFLLEGRLRYRDEAYWLSASLSETQSFHVLWSSRIKLPSVMSAQALDDIVAEIVGILDTRIDSAIQERARAKPETDLTVGDLIWRGRWHLNRLSKRDSAIAKSLFGQALTLDPQSPEALIQMTFCLAWSAWAARQSDDRIHEIRGFAHRAMLADCEDGRGFMLAGIAEMWLRRPMQARPLLLQAIALNPSLALAHAELGSCEIFSGRPSEAVSSLQTALRLSPNDLNLFYPLGELAMAEAIMGHWPQALDYAEQALLRRPSYWYAFVIKIKAWQELGDAVQARRALTDLWLAVPGFSETFLDWLPFPDPTWPAELKRALAEASKVSGERE